MAALMVPPLGSTDSSFLFSNPNVFLRDDIRFGLSSTLIKDCRRLIRRVRKCFCILICRDMCDMVVTFDRRSVGILRPHLEDRLWPLNLATI